MVKCRQLPVKVSVLFYQCTFDDKEYAKQLCNNIEQLYCNNIILKKGDYLVDTEGKEYYINFLSYSYQLNEGDSYISMTINLSD